MKQVLAGIDFGGTNTKIGLFDSKLNLLGRTSVVSGVDEGPDAVIDRMAEAVKSLMSDAGFCPEDLAAIGVGTPGPAEYKEGIIIASPNLPLFKAVPIKVMLSDKLNVGVVVDNDANAACWGEFVAGAGKDVSDMAFFTLGTGIGGGLVSDGKLVHGCGENAAELGHIIIYPDGRECGCGQRGCAEAYASANATAKRATEAIEAGAQSSLKKVLDEKGKIACKDVYEHLASGDGLAKKITDETAKTIALLCINVLHTTEPARIVFSGGMMAAGDALLNQIKHYFNEYVWKLKKETVEICFATLGEQAGIVGAAALAAQIEIQ